MPGSSEFHVLCLCSEVLGAGLAHMRERGNEAAVVLIAQDALKTIGDGTKSS